MRIFRSKRNGYRVYGLISCVLILLILGIIPLRLMIAYSQAPYPQAIFTLGGGKEREQFTAQFAQNHPALEIWVSSGYYPEKARPIFQSAGIPDSRVNFDTRAIDTVTNFTSLVAEFKRREIEHLYLITSDFHLPRAIAIATLVFGSWGIAFTPVAIPTQQPTESWIRVLRDVGRTLIWIVTGHTGARFHPHRSN